MKYLCQAIIIEDNGVETVQDSVRTDDWETLIEKLKNRHRWVHRLYIAMQIDTQEIVYKEYV